MLIRNPFRSWSRMPLTFGFLFCLLISGCQENDSQGLGNGARMLYEKGMYGYDAAFLRANANLVVELHDPGGIAKVLVSPEYQGRVMTSTAGGDSGSSFGWINYSLIGSRKFKPQFNPLGGEERFWLGPEGGQFGLYFKKGDSFTISHWQVPPLIDTLPFELDSSNATRVVCSKRGSLVNYAGTRFDLDIVRAVQLLDRRELENNLKWELPADVHAVAFRSENRIRNAGNNAWRQENGLLSIWLLGMMIPSGHTVVFIPFRPGADSRAGITDDYFGKISGNRLVIRDSLLFFTCDGKSRGKIGLSPRIARNMAASYNFDNNTLTLVLFGVDPRGLYVNSKWEHQAFPYRGDVVNAYNDGPLADGTQLGPFYELESSSPAEELRPGETQSYSQITCHMQGNYQAMKKLVMHLFGFDLDSMKNR